MMLYINEKIVEKKIKNMQIKTKSKFWRLNKFFYNLTQHWGYKIFKIFSFPLILLFLIYFLEEGILNGIICLIIIIFFDCLILRFAITFSHYKELTILNDIFKKEAFNEKYLKKADNPIQKRGTAFLGWINKPGKDYTAYKENLIKKYIYKHGIKAKQVLEIGCGTGKISNFYLNNRNKVFASDISFHYLVQIQNKEIHRVSAHSSHMPFKEKSFDIINFTEVIEHLNNPQKALEEIHRLLKDDGKLILSTGNNRHYLSFKCLNPLICLENIMGVYFPKFLPPRKMVDILEGVPFYHVRFAKAELIKLLSKTKFKFRIQTFGHFLSLRLPLQVIMILEKPIMIAPFIKNLGVGYFIIAIKQK